MKRQNQRSIFDGSPAWVMVMGMIWTLLVALAVPHGVLRTDVFLAIPRWVAYVVPAVSVAEVRSLPHEWGLAVTGYAWAGFFVGALAYARMDPPWRSGQEAQIIAFLKKPNFRTGRQPGPINVLIVLVACAALVLADFRLWDGPGLMSAQWAKYMPAVYGRSEVDSFILVAYALLFPVANLTLYRWLIRLLRYLPLYLRGPAGDSGRR